MKYLLFLIIIELYLCCLSKLNILCHDPVASWFIMFTLSFCSINSHSRIFSGAYFSICNMHCAVDQWSRLYFRCWMSMFMCPLGRVDDDPNIFVTLGFICIYLRSDEKCPSFLVAFLKYEKMIFLILHLSLILKSWYWKCVVK